MMTLRSTTVPTLMASIALLCAGCASTSPDYDARFSDTTRALLQRQVADPGAGQRHADQQPAMDGRSVREAGARQLESFRSPPAPQQITLGVSGGTSTGQ
jgi:hypothetical protein